MDAKEKPPRLRPLRWLRDSFGVVAQQATLQKAHVETFRCERPPRPRHLERGHFLISRPPLLREGNNIFDNSQRQAYGRKRRGDCPIEENGNWNNNSSSR